jgi:hypothetical protein
MAKNALFREQLRQLLLDVLNSVADDLRLPKLVPQEQADRKPEEDERSTNSHVPLPFLRALCR